MTHWKHTEAWWSDTGPRKGSALLVAFLLFLAACGPSDQQKRDTASATCAIVRETKLFQSADRVREFNAARSALNMEPYTDGDELIIESVERGLCEALVVDSDGSVLKGLQAQIAEESRKQLAEERERIAAKAAADEEKKKRDKEELDQILKDLADESAQQEVERLAQQQEREERDRAERDRAEKFRDHIVDRLKMLTISNTDLVVQGKSVPRNARLELIAPCVFDSEYFNLEMTVVFANREELEADYSFDLFESKCVLEINAYNGEGADKTLKPFLDGRNPITSVVAKRVVLFSGTGDFEGLDQSSISNRELNVEITLN